jgi:hypothetical protein
MRSTRVRFTVRRIMVAVAVVAILLAVYRMATYRVSQPEAIRIATDELQRFDKSFCTHGLMAKAYKTCGNAPWDVDFFRSGSCFLVARVSVSESGSVGQVIVFKESDRYVSNPRFEDFEAVPVSFSE